MDAEEKRREGRAESDEGNDHGFVDPTLRRHLVWRESLSGIRTQDIERRIASLRDKSEGQSVNILSRVNGANNKGHIAGHRGPVFHVTEADYRNSGT